MVKLEISSDDISVGKLLMLGGYILVALVMLWFSGNYPEQQQVANWYFALGIFGLVMIALDWVIKKLGKGLPEIPNVIVWEKGPIFSGFGKRWNIIIVGLAVAFGIANFFLIGSHTITQIVAAPSFQAVSFGVAGDALVSGLAGVTEDVVFILFIPATIFAVVNYFTKNPWIGIIIGIVASMPIFGVYHFLRYGSAQLVSTVTVTLMAGIWTTLAFVLRNGLVGHAWHFSNNAAVVYWTVVAGGAFTLWLGMILAIAVLGVTFWAAMRVKGNAPMVARL